MDSGVLFSVLVIFLHYVESEAQESCDGKYWCDKGHCCGKGRCCAYYYELWWFWLIWGVVILMSCCCLYQQRRIKLRHQRSQGSALPLPRSASCHLSFLRSLDARLFPLLDGPAAQDCHLPSYEEAKHLPKDENPPAYESLFSQSSTAVQGAITPDPSPEGPTLAPQNCLPCSAIPAPPNSCAVSVDEAEDCGTSCSSAACSNTHDSAGLLENEVGPGVSPPPYSLVVKISPS